MYHICSKRAMKNIDSSCRRVFKYILHACPLTAVCHLLGGSLAIGMANIATARREARVPVTRVVVRATVVIGVVVATIVVGIWWKGMKTTTGVSSRAEGWNKFSVRSFSLHLEQRSSTYNGNFLHWTSSFHQGCCSGFLGC